MTKLVTVLRGGGDLIILDCAPAPAGPEAALIARHADATVLAVRQSALQTAAVANATRILEGAQAAPIGIVVLS
jgi:Mrp family chromosome partitioning ATPase